MTTRNEAVEAVLAVLRQAGISAPVISQGARHIQVRWTSPRGQTRMVTIASSPSDCRAVENARSDARRILREDGMLPDNERREPVREMSRLDKLEQRLMRLENLVQQGAGS